MTPTPHPSCCTPQCLYSKLMCADCFVPCFYHLCIPSLLSAILCFLLYSSIAQLHFGLITTGHSCSITSLFHVIHLSTSSYVLPLFLPILLHLVLHLFFHPSFLHHRHGWISLQAYSKPGSHTSLILSHTSVSLL